MRTWREAQRVIDDGLGPSTEPNFFGGRILTRLARRRIYLGNGLYAPRQCVRVRFDHESPGDLRLAIGLLNLAPFTVWLQGLDVSLFAGGEEVPLRIGVEATKLDRCTMTAEITRFVALPEGFTPSPGKSAKVFARLILDGPWRETPAAVAHEGDVLWR